MRTIGIVVTNPKDWTALAFCNAVKRYGMHPVKIDFKKVTSFSSMIYSCGVNLTTLEAIIVRDIGPSTLKDISFRYSTLLMLEEEGVKIINNPESIAWCANKHISSFLLQKNDIPVPETLVTNNLRDALKFLCSHNKAVIKPVYGYKGIGVTLLKNDDEGMQKLQQVLEREGVVYMQEFVNYKKDIRAFVVNHRVVASICRVAPEGKWVSNLSQGGVAKPCSLTEEQIALSLKAARVMGTIFAGVDIIEGEKSYVLEVNATPSCKGIFEACGVDATMHIAEYVYEMLKT